MCQTTQDLSEHDRPEIICPRPTISNPVPKEEKDRRNNDRGSRPSSVQDQYRKWRDDYEGEEEARTQPIDGACRHIVVLSRCGTERRIGEPLSVPCQLTSIIVRIRSMTYVPAHDDIEQRQLE